MLKRIAIVGMGIAIGAMMSSAWASEPQAWHSADTLTLELPADNLSQPAIRPVRASHQATPPSGRYLKVAFNETQRTPINVDTHLMALQLNVDDNTEFKIKVHSGYYFSVSKRW